MTWENPTLEKEHQAAAQAGAGHKTRLATKQTRILLLHGPIMARGALIEPKAKYLGAGAYEITWEEVQR